MKSLFIHICIGLLIFPISLLYWLIYWHIQPVDPHSLRQGHDVVTGKVIPKRAITIQVLGYSGAVLAVLAWMIFGNQIAKGVYYIDLLELFQWSESAFYDYLRFWLLLITGLVALAWFTAKKLVSRKKWTDDQRRLY